VGPYIPYQLLSPYGLYGLYGLYGYMGLYGLLDIHVISPFDGGWNRIPI